MPYQTSISGRAYYDWQIIFDISLDDFLTIPKMGRTFTQRKISAFSQHMNITSTFPPPEITVSSLSIQQLDDRINQLLFLAESITEQTQLLEGVQSKYWRQLRKAGKQQRHFEQSPHAARIEDSSSKDEMSDSIPDQQTALQITLARKEEKLRAQTKSLALRFRGERAQLQLEKTQLESLKAQLQNQAKSLDVKRIGTLVQQTGTSESEHLENPSHGTIITVGYSDGSESNDNTCSITEMEKRLTELQAMLANSEAENHVLFWENRALRGQTSSSSENGEFDQQASQRGELLDTRRQLEMTLEQLQDARSEITRLKTADIDAAEAETTWEEQKKRLLASLEDDIEPTLENPRELLQRLKKAEDSLTQKDQKIAQLETLLKSQQEGVDGDTITAEEQNQHKKILDRDEVIAKERHRLAELEQHWREKIGKAEIELSQERSRLSRDRAAFESSLRELENKASEAASSNDADNSSKKPRKGRWMERLGL